MSDTAPKAFKIFPRNLTARADAIVRGNPVSSRPESGVENSFPGLEFDQRNLDKAFFPGLLFEMHHDAGVFLRRFAPDGSAAPLLKATDLDEGVFMVFLQGRYASRTIGVPPRDRTTRIGPPAGLESWRLVRDLEPGPVAVALVRSADYPSVTSGALDSDVVTAWFSDRRDREESVGELRVILLFGVRARFLTADGVIDPKLLEPGDLTRSLCSPWQYDFADCGCFYWASNKPDMVSSDAQPDQVLNFQRKDRSPEGDKATGSEDWLLKHGGRWDGEALAMRHAEMMQRWSDLPFVIGGREVQDFTPRASAVASKPLTRAEIVSRLRVLAGVEHGLAVEYLYAYYSLALPPVRPVDALSAGARIWTAGEEVFQVALDEMRHLRSVNEMLILLEEPPALQRATIIGEDLGKDGKAFERPFELTPLTRGQLDWFIAVEAASQNSGGDQDTIDGMYTLLLRSIGASKDLDADVVVRMTQLIKTIIDEGIDHYQRFSGAKKALAGIPEAQYLRVTTAPERRPDGDPDRLLQDTFDAAYVVMLGSLDYVFRRGDGQRGALLEGARRAMSNMDDAARSLAAHGVPAMFALSATAPQAGLGPATAAAPTSVRSIGDPLRSLIDRLDGAGSAEQRALGRRLRGRLDEMTRTFEDTPGE